MALNVNIIGKDSEGNLRALKVNSEGNLEISDSLGWGELLQDISDKLDILVGKLSGNIVELPRDPSFPTTITAGATVLMFGSTSDGLGDFKAIRVGWVTWSDGCNIELDVSFYPRARYDSLYRIGRHKKTLSGSGQIYINELVEVVSPYFTVHVTNKDTSDTTPAGIMVAGVR